VLAPPACAVRDARGQDRQAQRLAELPDATAHDLISLLPEDLAVREPEPQPRHQPV